MKKKIISKSYKILDVTFKSQGEKLAGNLYVPGSFDKDANTKYPTVLFSGPFNQVKEQTGAVYGKKLATKGYITLVFDHIGYGDSEGKIKNFENPFTKMETIRDGVSYLNTLSYTDSVYGLGVCASGGYMPIVATTDKRLKAIATVSGMLDNTNTYFNMLSEDQMNYVLKDANKSRQKLYETGKIDYYDSLGLESYDLKKLDKNSSQYQGYDYYMTKRGGSETYKNFSHLSPKNLMEFSPLTSAMNIAKYLRTPYLGVYGEKADTGPLTKAFFKETTKPKKLVEIPKANHLDLYDKDEYVDDVVGEITDFFGSY